MAGRKPVSKPQWRISPQAPQRLQELDPRRVENSINKYLYRDTVFCRDADTAKRLLALIEIAEGKGAL